MMGFCFDYCFTEYAEARTSLFSYYSDSVEVGIDQP